MALAARRSACAPVRPRRSASFAGALLIPAPAWPVGLVLPMITTDSPGEQELTGLVVLILLLFATFTAVLHLLGRHNWTRREKALTAELTQTHARLDRANLFLSSEPQIVVAWSAADGDPEIEGDYSLVTDTPLPRRVLGFGSWLAPDLAQKMDHAVERLRERGEGFSVAVASTRGRHFEIDGRAVAGRAVMRIRDVSGDRLQLRAASGEPHRAARRAQRDPRDARCDSPSGLDARRRGTARLGERRLRPRGRSQGFGRGRRARARAVRWRCARGGPCGARRGRRLAPARARRRRRRAAILYEVADIESADRLGGHGQRSLRELTALRGELEQQVWPRTRARSTNCRPASRSSTAANGSSSTIPPIANCGRSTRPSSTSAPTDSERFSKSAARQAAIARTGRFPRLEGGQLSSRLSVAIDTSEHVWYLPDRRTLRVVASPNVQGGVTYLFDDVTQRFNLESRFNALTRVQSETLDTLKEGVAVFGTDGRLKLYNPAFAALWRFDPGQAPPTKPHIDEIVEISCAPLSRRF